MRFYNNQHQFYAGIDLHARKIYICIIDGKGNVLLYKNMDSIPENLARSFEPYLPDIVVGIHRYWIPNYCEDQLGFVSIFESRFI